MTVGTGGEKKGGSMSRPEEPDEVDKRRASNGLRVFFQHFKHFAVELVTLIVFILHIRPTAVEDTEIAF